jgi:hypothetical protein
MQIEGAYEYKTCHFSSNGNIRVTGCSIQATHLYKVLLLSGKIVFPKNRARHMMLPAKVRLT